MNKNQWNYKRAGVDIEAGYKLLSRIRPQLEASQRPGQISGLGGFASLFDLRAAGFSDPLLVSGADGVGTKLLLALEAERLEGLGQDLVAMCVNDILTQGARPLFFLDYYACGQLVPEKAARVIKGIADACRAVGAALAGGETAELPGLYNSDHFDLAGFVVGAVERSRRLDPTSLHEGDRLLGLASSGLHSNGFSLVRALLSQRLSDSGERIDSPSLPDPSLSWAELLLAPTRLYSPLLLPLVEAGLIKAMAHITGGGIVENAPRLLPQGAHGKNELGLRLNLSRLHLSPLFAWLRDEGELDSNALLSTFNLGIGMILAVEKSKVDKVKSSLEEKGEKAVDLGEITKRQEEGAINWQGVEEFLRVSHTL